MTTHAVPPPPAPVAVAPMAVSLVNQVSGGLATASYFLNSRQPLITSGLVWQAWDLLGALCSGPWLDGLGQYGVHSCTYGGYGVGAQPPGQPPQAPAGTFGILICDETEAHLFDGSGPNGLGVYGVSWTGFHSDVAGMPYAVCPIPDASINGNPPLDIFTLALTHEMAELLTDPAPYAGWVFPAPAGQTQPSEACDTVCMAHRQTVTTSHGNPYQVSAYWRNDLQSCWVPALPAPPSPPPGP